LDQTLLARTLHCKSFGCKMNSLWWINMKISAAEGNFLKGVGSRKGNRTWCHRVHNNTDRNLTPCPNLWCWRNYSHPPENIRNDRRSGGRWGGGGGGKRPSLAHWLRNMATAWWLHNSYMVAGYEFLPQSILYMVRILVPILMPCVMFQRHTCPLPVMQQSLH
jgi:hypothetical protein